MHARTQVGLFSLLDHLEDPAAEQGVTVSQRLREVVEQGILAEQVGFDRFGVGEHHFSKYVLPNPNLILAALATRTSRLRLFTAVTLLACREPVQLAEDIGVLDCLSQGRTEFSFARGVSWEAARVFGVAPDNVYALMADKLDRLLGLLTTGNVSPAANVEDIQVVPRSIQLPHPPLWVGGGIHAESCLLAVERALPLMLPSLFRYPEDYLPLVERYRAEMAAAGQTARVRVAMPSYCWVAKTSQAARQTWQPRLERYVRYASSLRESHGRPTDFEGLLRGPAICGSPAEVVDRIGALNQSMGLDHHILLMDAGGVPFEELRTALELMGSDVLPHFNRQ
jgi:alkanesulfonate monooxygenase SsuD/methylene tetrahydromethanopterin reductase-like flavin-dependent oxidoreductase (luciferase family)